MSELPVLSHQLEASTAEETLRLSPPRRMTLDRALEWIDHDELVEVTPSAVRVRKRLLRANERPRTRNS